MPTPSLHKRAWSKGHVYLVTYPRCGSIPNASPWSLKLETWLRVTGIPYTGISNEFKHFSTKGQVPFVELNGRQIADSNVIIDKLTEEFELKDLEPTDSMDKARDRAITALVEDNLIWTLFSLRTQDQSYLTSDEGWGRHLGTGIKKRLLKFFARRRMNKLLNDRCNAHGMGRNSMDEIERFAKADIDALSSLLGDKEYFFGDKIRTLDCTVFGHLAQFLHTTMPHGSPTLPRYIHETKPNLADFVHRIKEKYWPDWQTTCESMDLNTHHQSKEGTESEETADGKELIK